jgi:hypothetical protein
MKESVLLDQWAYAIGVGILISVWLVFFFLRRDLRRRMLGVSLALVPLAPLGQYLFLQDYWRPPVLFPIPAGPYQVGGVFDLLFSFAFGGIATASYYVISGNTLVSGRYRAHYWLIGAFLALQTLTLAVLTVYLRINSIFSSSIAFLAVFAVCLTWRKDLLKVGIISGAICGIALAGAEAVLSFVVPAYLSHYWLLFDTGSGFLIVDRVPLTEALWGTTFGLSVGVLIDATFGSSALTQQLNDAVSNTTGCLARDSRQLGAKVLPIAAADHPVFESNPTLSSRRAE